MASKIVPVKNTAKETRISFTVRGVTSPKLHPVNVLTAHTDESMYFIETGACVKFVL